MRRNEGSCPEGAPQTAFQDPAGRQPGVGSGGPDALRLAALAAADGFLPFLRDGGERFGACWAALMHAIGTHRENPGPKSANALRHAMERLWATPPDAFADAVSAGEWAMEARPAIRRARVRGRSRTKGGSGIALPT